MGNSGNNYGFIVKLLHWSVALLILGLLSLGFYMHGLESDPFKFKLYGFHKSFGVMVLGLAGLRVFWRLINPPPPAIAAHPVWERILARIIRILLYFIIFAMPLSGWLMSSAGGHATGFFGLFELPAPFPKDKALFKLMKETHEILAFVTIGAVGLHMIGAFKHHFIDRDETLKRMTNRRLGLLSGTILALIAAILIAAPLILSGLQYVESSGGGDTQISDSHFHDH